MKKIVLVSLSIGLLVVFSSNLFARRARVPASLSSQEIQEVKKAGRDIASESGYQEGEFFVDNCRVESLETGINGGEIQHVVWLRHCESIVDYGESDAKLFPVALTMRPGSKEHVIKLYQEFFDICKTAFEIGKRVGFRFYRMSSADGKYRWTYLESDDFEKGVLNIILR